MFFKTYIALIVGLLSFVLNSPSCFESFSADGEEVEAMWQGVLETEQYAECYICDVQAESSAILAESIGVPNQVMGRTVRTQPFSLRYQTSFANYLYGRVKSLLILVKHNSWRLFPSSAPFFSRKSHLFYVYALREIIR